MKFAGKTPSSIIQVKEETSKNPGDQITIGLRMQLAAEGVTGDGTLQDNEEALTTYTDAMIINQLRNAVRSAGKMSEQRVTFDVREEAKSALVDWFSGRLDTWGFNQLCGNTAETRTAYTGLQPTIAPDANHEILAGAVANDQSITNTNIFDITLIDKCVERARTLTPGIRPVKVMGGEYYVIFLHPYQVTDLRTSVTSGQWLDIQKAAMTGGKVDQNPLFTGAMGMYNNTIIHVDSRVTNGVNSSTSASIATVKRAIFCGAQAGIMAFGRDYGSVDRFKWVEQLFDYENQLGVAAGLVAGMKKSVFNATDFATIVVATYGTQH